MGSGELTSATAGCLASSIAERRMAAADPRAMRLRLELLIAALDPSIAFYVRVPGFELQRRDADYANLRGGDVVLGLGPIAKLPDREPGPGFSVERPSKDRGAGVEIVLEVDDVAAALDRVRQAAHPLVEPLGARPWGLSDFRIVDPDGYYWRVTSMEASAHGPGGARVPSLHAALNGDREHPAAPRTPDALAVEARAAVDAGARSLHLHPYDGDDRETLGAEPCASALRAVRATCPGMPISLSTSAGIVADPERRHALISAWTDLPDLVTANMGENAILELCELLLARGIGIEAGLLALEDAHAFVASGIAPSCVRVLVEPLDPVPRDAVAHAEAIERVLESGGVRLEQVHHGDGVASWAVNRRAAVRGHGHGHGIRTGLEDTPVGPDGRTASGNGELVAAGAALIAQVRGAKPATRVET